MGRPEVEAQRLVKVYPNGVEAVRGVSFKAGVGVTVVMGPNGSGKTTTLSMIAGVLRPTSGRALVCGFDVWGSDWLRARECVGYAPQSMPYREALRVIDNLVWYGMLRGMSPREARTAAREALESVGLGGRENARVSELSGGQRRRLNIAAVLLWQPEVLLLDEPTSGLDPAAREALWGTVRGLARDRVVLATSHIAEEVERYADEVIIIHRGRVVASGRPSQLIEKYAPRGRVIVEVEGPGRPPESLGGARLARFTGSTAVYTSEDVDEDLPLIVEGLYRSGFRVRRAEARKPSLLEAFLAIVEDSGVEGGA